MTTETKSERAVTWWRSSTIGQYVFAVLALAVALNWFFAEGDDGKVFASMLSFLFCVLMVFVSNTNGFRGAPFVIGALLLSLGSCASQLVVMRVDGERVWRIVQEFSCEDGRQIVATGEAFGRRWSLVDPTSRRYSSRAEGLIQGADLFMTVGEDADAVYYTLHPGGWDSGDSIGGATCAKATGAKG